MGQHKHKRDAGMFQQLSHSKTAAGTYVGVLHIHSSPVVVRTYRSPNLSVVSLSRVLLGSSCLFAMVELSCEVWLLSVGEVSVSG